MAHGKNILFVLAHQDDECPMSTRIARELAAAQSVHCVFLTDGEARGRKSHVRDRESLRALTGLGVPAANVHLLGTATALAAEQLVFQLGRGLEHLEQAVGDRLIHRVYCLAYEGGHHDHDASHLIALAFARRRGLLRRTWQVPFYNGYGLPGKLFRTYQPLPKVGRICQRKLPPREAVRHSLLCLKFRSQWSTWLGLFPGSFLERALLRRERIQSVGLSRLRERPHPGPLLYEQLFGFEYDRFRSASADFVAEHLSPAKPTSPQGD